MNREKCEVCEEPGGIFTTGLPGVFGRVHLGQPITNPTRCLECNRYESDEAAAQALEAWLDLRAHGYISEPSGG